MKGTEKKKEIRHKAIALFQERGFENVSVNEIARNAHISKNTFYYYFDSKEDIIREEFNPERMHREELSEKVRGFKSGREGVLYIYTSLCAYYEGLGPLIVKKGLFLNLTDPIVNTRTGKDRHPLFYIIQEACERGFEDGSIVRREGLAVTLQYVFMGCVYIWATASSKKNLTEMVLTETERLV